MAICIAMVAAAPVSMVAEIALDLIESKSMLLQVEHAKAKFMMSFVFAFCFVLFFTLFYFHSLCAISHTMILCSCFKKQMVEFQSILLQCDVACICSKLDFPINNWFLFVFQLE